MRFLLHRTKYAVFTADGTKSCISFSVGDTHKFTFRLSEFCEQLERIYDSGVEIIPLVGEIVISVDRGKANADAERDHESEIRKREDARRTADQ